jgi:NDP-sugar pyrophosphorylase family protein
MRKTRISMTISDGVLRDLDSIVDGRDIRSRSEAIENILKRHLESNKIAVFLGGGDPEELKINGVFRPLVRIRGKRLIEHNLDVLRKSGFRKIYLIGRDELVGECFKILGNGSRYNVDIKYIEEERSAGNSKTLQLAEKSVRSSFLVLPIDNFFDFDLNYLVNVHTSNPGLVTLAVQAERGSATGVDVVEMVGNQIVSYEEKPSKPKTFLTSTFIGMYDPAVFEYIPRGNVKWVLQSNLFRVLMRKGRLYGCIIPGAYANIHDGKDLRKISNTKVLLGNK